MEQPGLLDTVVSFYYMYDPKRNIRCDPWVSWLTGIIYVPPALPLSYLKGLFVENV